MAQEGETGGERSRSADRRDRRADAASATDSAGGKGRATAVRDRGQAKPSIFARLALFLRQVVAELRKVTWPTRQELITYTVVVLVFVSFMVALVAGLDFVFGLGVQFLFGT